MPWRCCTSEHKKMNSKVLVYRGEGAGWRSVKSTCESVERLLSGPLRPLIKPLQVTTFPCIGSQALGRINFALNCGLALCCMWCPQQQHGVARYFHADRDGWDLD